jgi:predicted amidohydrolase YtcJ
VENYILLWKSWKPFQRKWKNPEVIIGRRRIMKSKYIIKSNCIFDSIKSEPYEGFIVVKDNVIQAVGTDPCEMDKYLEPNIKIYEFKNKLVMPGFHDSHTHLLLAGLYKACANMGAARSEEEAVHMLYDFEKAHPTEGWVYGFNWYHVFWDNKALPTRFSLDHFFPDRPVFLVNAEAHGAWVNSKALEIAGITKDTPDPAGGYFERDEHGEPTGFIYESAMGAVTKYALDFTEQREKQLIKTYMEDAISKGITSVNDMKPFFHGLVGRMETYDSLDKSGELKIRINAAADLLGDLGEAEIWRKKYKSGKFRVNLLKQFLDGVCTTHTALMLEEYIDSPGNFGVELNDLKAIENSVLEAHKRGFNIRLHSCGDKSARLALDFYQNAIELYGKKSCRHGIEHIEVIKHEDIPRFKQFGIIPSVQPEHLALTQTFEENPYPMVLGKERADKNWPFRSLYDAAGCLAIGSDCPIVDNDPFFEIYRAITRVHNDGKPEGGWNPTEKLSLYQVLKSYTYGSAYGVCRENELGTLEPGKLADIIVIDRNLFTIEPKEILNSEVLLTIVDGDIVFEQ